MLRYDDASQSLVQAVTLSLMVVAADAAQEPRLGGAARLEAWEQHLDMHDIWIDPEHPQRVLLPTAAVVDLAVQGRDAALVAATHGLSLFLPDIHSIRQAAGEGISTEPANDLDGPDST